MWKLNITLLQSMLKLYDRNMIQDISHWYTVHVSQCIFVDCLSSFCIVW